MYRKKTQGWGKHLDFILIDLCSMYLALFVSYVIRHHSWELLFDDRYQELLIPLLLLNVTFVIGSNGFKNVLRRGRRQELWASVRQVAMVQLGLLFYMYVMKISSTYSRQIIIVMTVFYVIFTGLFRTLWKDYLHRRMKDQPGNALIIITTKALVHRTVQNIVEYNFERNRLAGLILLDEDCRGREMEGIPVVAAGIDAAEYICREWVDEVLIALPGQSRMSLGIFGAEEKRARTNSGSGRFCEEEKKSKTESGTGRFCGEERKSETGSATGRFCGEEKKSRTDFGIGRFCEEEATCTESELGRLCADAQTLIATLHQMGVVVHTVLSEREESQGMSQSIEKFGNYNVITSSINYAASLQLSVKRLLDLLGGVVGCCLTVLLTVVLAPAIYIQSPGPVFYAQTRVGRNGRRFKIYKFRSMYVDADVRKQELMAENRIGDGRMFKLDWDPRIIGSKILPDGTKKRGLGNFIRDYSLDEFPQFFNVLKGEMSLVGTRPPTVDEWEKYKPWHRTRLAVRPGITGMWQVSGRSRITDFEEVVRLDTQYINQWSLGLDLKILLKTVKVVLTRDGAM